MQRGITCLAANFGLGPVKGIPIGKSYKDQLMKDINLMVK